MFSMQQLILYNLVYRIWGNLIVVLIMWHTHTCVSNP